MSASRGAAGAALVTGAGRRLGLALAEALAADGWAVALHHGRSAAGAGAAVARIRDGGGRAAALRADLADGEAARGLVPRASDALERPLDLLVHNAAVFRRDDIRDVTAAGWAEHMAVNVAAPVFLTQAFAAQLPPGQAGNIVSMLDQRVFNPTPYYMSYAASKSALWSLTRIWALELAPAIRVNAIGPGIALPEVGSDAASMERWTRRYPLRRGTGPEEIAGALRFILSAPALTGQMIVLDGGQHLGWLHPAEARPGAP